MGIFEQGRRAGFTILESVIMLAVLAILSLLVAGVMKTEFGGEGSRVEKEAMVEP